MNTTSYTWRPSYQLPLESFRSCVEKFSFLNGESYTASKEFMIKEYRKPICTSIQELLTQKHYLYNKIRYCPECLNRMGYHSVLHQSKFFDTCFLHPNCKLISGELFLESTKLCSEMQEYYKVKSIVSESDDKSRLQSLFEKIELQVCDTTFFLLDFGIWGNREGRLFDSLKEYVGRTFFFLPSKASELKALQRKVCTISKRELPDLSKQAIQTLMDDTINAKDGIPINDKIHIISELKNLDKRSLDCFCPLYLRSVIWNFVFEHFKNLDEYCRVSNKLMLGYLDPATVTKTERMIYAKLLMIETLIGRHEPLQFLGLWSNISLKHCSGLNFDQLLPWYKGDHEHVLYALFKDIFEYGAVELEKMILRGEIDLSQAIHIPMPYQWLLEYAFFYRRNDIFILIIRLILHHCS